MQPSSYPGHHQTRLLHATAVLPDDCHKKLLNSVTKNC